MKRMIYVMLFVLLPSLSAFASDYAFYPACDDAKTLGRYNPGGGGFGWIDTTDNGGFSCRRNSGAGNRAYPVCFSEATNKDGNTVFLNDGDDWGWVSGSGFSCAGASGDQPAPIPPGGRQDVSLNDAPLRIVSLYVSHGDANFIFLPNGKIMLIDTGQYYFAKKYIEPFITSQGINHIDYVVITHTHGDHVGGLNHLRKMEQQGKLSLGQVWINDASNPDDMPARFANNDFGLEMSVLSWYANSIVVKQWCFADNTQCKNERSLSIYLKYNGFTYAMGGDIYKEQQDKILREKSDKVRVHAYRTNHHMHGSVSTEYLRATDPALFITSAESSVYQRPAYTVELQGVVDDLKRNGSRFEASLLTQEHGHNVIWVQSGQKWSWRNYGDSASLHVNSIYNMPKLKQ